MITDRVGPLSYEQERQWLLHQMDRQNPANNSSYVLKLTGQLRADVLKRCFNEIFLRHEIIRARFPEENGTPYMAIMPQVEIDLPLIDLSQLGEPERSRSMDGIVLQEAVYSFDLQRDFLFRGTLIRLSEDKHVLVLVFHHIIFDGWSIGILLKELTLLYESLLEQQGNAPLGELPQQYLDYAIRQRDLYAGNALTEQLKFWQEYLGDELPTIDLSFGGSRNSSPSHSGRKYSFIISAEKSNHIKTICRSERVTLFMFLLSVFNTMLYRYTNQGDIMTGCYVSGRNQPDTEQLLGLFINTIVVKTSLNGKLSFRETLRMVRESVLKTYNHQALPFAKVVTELNLMQRLGGNPVFNVSFNMHNMPRSTLCIAGIQFEELDYDYGISLSDLCLKVSERNGEIACWFIYDTNLFGADVIQRMAEHFQIILSGIISGGIGSQNQIAKLPMLSEAEKNLLLEQWKGKKTNYPKGKCIHELFEDYAKRTPEETALVFENVKLSYQELNDKANMLAKHIQGMGVATDSLVGIYIDRSLEMVIAILAILKAGGAYVPIDPDYPEERSKFIMEDTQMKICLTLDKFQSRLLGSVITTIALDGQWDTISQQSGENVDSGVTSSNLAYVMYTSGSTGKPKGVMILHESVLALLDGCEVLAPSDGKVTGTTISTYSFDTSVWEIFSMLCYGRELHIITPEIYTSASAFAEYLVKNKITTTYVNPVLIVDTVNQLEKVNITNHLNYFKTGLEAKKQKVLQAVRDISDDMLIANLYGPTETTVCGTFYEFKYAENPEDETPIGKPMPNYEVYIVDRNLELLPPGIPGELLIGGVCVSQGYLNRPELTAEKFISNPVLSDDPYKVYRTGDRVRFLADGNIEFIGRMDNQFKIHGYRIEAGEIESAISSHTNIKRAVVMITEYSAQDKRLTAYIVPFVSQPDLVQEIKAFLGEKLPRYMIPSVFVMVDEIPQLLNGKVNYSALLPVNGINDIQRQYIAPRNDMERQIAEIWREIFKCEEISVQDNFFDLGGYSLLAVRLFHAIEQTVGVRIALSHILEAPTIAQQAIWIIGHNTMPESSLVTIRSNGTKPPLFCIHAIDGEVMPYGNLAPHLADDQPVYGLRLNVEDVKSETGNMKNLAAKYVAEIRSVQSEGPYFLLGYSFGGVLAFELAQQLYSIGQEVAFLGFFDTMNPQYRPQRLWIRLPLFKRLARSFNKFKAVSAGQRMTYLLMKLDKWLKGIKKSDFSSDKKNDCQEILANWKDEYVPAIYPGRITIFRAVDEQKRYSDQIDEKLGWEGLAQGGLIVYEVAGDHGTIVYQENIKSLGERLMACLQETQGTLPTSLNR